MQRNKNTKKLSVIAIVVFAVLIGTWLFFFVRINRQYPQTVLREYQINEPLKISSCSICVTEAELLPYEEFKEKYQYVDERGYEHLYLESNRHIIRIRYNVKNESGQSCEMPHVEYITLDSVLEPTSTVFDDAITGSVVGHDYSFLLDEMEANESRTFDLYFSVAIGNMTSFRNRKPSLEDFKLVATLYPVKNVFILEEN